MPQYLGSDKPSARGPGTWAPTSTPSRTREVEASWRSEALLVPCCQAHSPQPCLQQLEPAQAAVAEAVPPSVGAATAAGVDSRTGTAGVRRASLLSTQPGRRHDETAAPGPDLSEPTGQA